MRTAVSGSTDAMLRLLAALVAVSACITTLGASPASAAKPRGCQVRNEATGRTHTRLQAAVDAATSGQTLTVMGTCIGLTDIRKDIVIRGVQNPRWGRPILDGARQTRVLYVRRVATLTVETLTIQRGLNEAQGHLVGGGIANFGTLTLRSVIVRDNFAVNGGGGVYNEGSLTLAGRTRISDNRAPYGGGGIHSVVPGGRFWGASAAGEAVPTSVTLNDTSTVSGNKHGGVFIGHGTVTMNDASSISGNKDVEGGGVYVEWGRLILNDASSVSDNRANERGGGVFLYGGTLTMNGASSISGNRAVAADGTPGLGGGLYHSPDENPTGVVCGAGGNVHDNSPDDCHAGDI